MAYTKTVWVNDIAPARNATNLNKQEQGIYDAHLAIGNIKTIDPNAADIPLEIQNAIDAIGRATGDITKGAILLPDVAFDLDTTIEVQQQSIDFIGRPGTQITWTGAASQPMFRAVDSSRCTWDTMNLLGNDSAQPSAAIYFDEPAVSTLGTNEYCIVRNVMIGRRYTQDSASTTSLERGIHIGGLSGTNNDSFYIQNCQINECTTAGIAVDNAQSVWGSITDVLINLCGYGIYTGASLQCQNVCFNRNTVADLHAFRDISVNIYGFNSEHSFLPISQSQNASISIDGGKILLQSELTGDNWANIGGMGSLLSLKNLMVLESGVSGKKLSVNGSSSFRGELNIRNSLLPGGDDGTGYDINMTTSHLGCDVDIKHGAYELKRFVKYNVITDPNLLNDGDGQAITTTSATLSEIAVSDLFIPSFSADLQGITLTGGVYQAQGLVARFQNESGGAIDLPSSTLSWRKIEDRDIKSQGSVTYDQTLLTNGSGATTTIIVPGAQMGDFVTWSSSKQAYARDLCVTVYVSAADTVSMRVQNESGGSSDPASGDLRAAVVRENGDYIGAAIYDPPNLSDATGLTTTIDVPGVNIGDFVLVSFSNDLQGILMTGYVSAADTVSVRLQNETGGAIDLASGTLRAMIYSNQI